MTQVVVKRQLDEGDHEAVSHLLDAVGMADGHRLLGNGRALGPAGQESSLHAALVAREAGHDDPVGFAEVRREGDGWSLEVVVRPGLDRRDAVWDRLLGAGWDVVRSEGGGPVRLWVHDVAAEHDQVARSLGLRPSRDLRQMRRPLPLGQSFSLPVRAFVVGQDEEAWLHVNNRAFADHPDQGGRTLQDLRRLEGEPWFDPEGFLLHERDGRLAGFCWTKVHVGARPSVGELYVVAVDPDFQGLGLGRLLALAGLEWLAGRGLATAMLYVDASNRPAVGLYERLGFTVHHVDRAYVGVVPPINEPRT